MALTTAGAAASAYAGLWIKECYKRPNFLRYMSKIATLAGAIIISALCLSHLKTIHFLHVSIAWASVIFVLMIVVQGNKNISNKGWLVPCLLSITAVYTPFVVAAGWTWLYAGCPHCTAMWLKMLWVSPGAFAAASLSAISFHRNIDVHPIVGYVIAGLLSAAIVGVFAWLARKSPWVRWPSLAAAGLSAYSAMALYALVRA